MQNPELAAIEVRGTTRGAFLLRGALAAGAVFGAGAVSPFVRDALAQGKEGGDLATLNFALTLEYLEATFYERALMKGKGLSPDTKALALEIHENEKLHVKALQTAIKSMGATPVTAPEVGFGSAFTSEANFLALAQTLEDTGVSAYNGAAPGLESPKLLAAAGSIVQIEARHASLIRLTRGQLPTPDAFDKSLGRDEVVAAVKPFMR
jgi:Ferritin-like domain